MSKYCNKYYSLLYYNLYQNIPLNIVVFQALLNEPFLADDAENLERLTQCIKEAMPLFSKNVHSMHFVQYLCNQVIPVLSSITVEGATLQLLKLLAEMSVHAGEFDSVSLCVAAVYSKLIEYMPLPPAEAVGVDIEGIETTRYLFNVSRSNVLCFRAG